MTEKDYELTLIKDKSTIDYIYNTSIKDKQTDKIVFKSKVWQYSIIAEDEFGFLPSLKIDKSIFKKSRDYKIIIQPLMDWIHCWECGISEKETEKYISRYTLSITLDEENYSKTEFLIYTLIAAFFIGLVFLVILYFIKKEAKKVNRKRAAKNIAKLQLNSIRSQLNPLFRTCSFTSGRHSRMRCITTSIRCMEQSVSISNSSIAVSNLCSLSL